MRDLANMYGVLVRAGAVTPQQEDEVFMREKLSIPEAGTAVKQRWNSDGGTRRPLTIKQPEDNNPDPAIDQTDVE